MAAQSKFDLTHGIPTKIVPVSADIRIPYKYIVIILSMGVFIVAMLNIGCLFCALGYINNFDLDLRVTFGISTLCASIFTGLWLLSGGAKLHTLVARSRQIRLSLISWTATSFVFAWATLMLQEARTNSWAAISLSLLVGTPLVLMVCVAGSMLLSSAFRRGHIVLGEIAFIGIGDGSAMDRTIGSIEAIGFRVASRSEISTSDLGGNAFLNECELAASDILETLGTRRLEGVWIHAPRHEYRRIEELKMALSRLPLPLLFCCEGETGILVKSPLEIFCAFKGVEVQRAPFTRTERAIKRTLDLSIASVALVVLSPLMILATMAVLIETGRSVLSRQSCRGLGGKPFDILKFRTTNEPEDGVATPRATYPDSHETWVGPLLRHTNIDALPHLFNVLKGDMSIVGPRPHTPLHDAFYEGLVANYASRLHVKPGITGWAQVNGFCGKTAELAKIEAFLEKDLWYIHHWSIWLDIRIILRTVLAATRIDKA